MAITSIRTHGLRCESCDRRVQLELEDIEGVESATSDHETGIVLVVYDEARCDAAAFKPAIEGLDPDFKVVG
jgi:copper chaperone